MSLVFICVVVFYMHASACEYATPGMYIRFLWYDMRRSCHLFSFAVVLSIKQGGIKYHFLSLWYDSTWDWTLGLLASILLIRPMARLNIVEPFRYVIRSSNIGNGHFFLLNGAIYFTYIDVDAYSVFLWDD